MVKALMASPAHLIYAHLSLPLFRRIAIDVPPYDYALVPEALVVEDLADLIPNALFGGAVSADHLFQTSIG
jgi:hypothetical protein